MRIGVTGGLGYVGSRLADACEQRGAEVVRLGHDDLPLEGPLDRGRLEGLDAIVHAAWDFRPRAYADYRRINVDGSVHLLETAAAAGVERIAFISTLSAYSGCRSMYGEAKLTVEARAIELGGVVVRPGLVWGSPGGSLYERIAQAASRWSVLPVFTGKRQRLHMAHEHDLASFVADAVLDDRPPQGIVAAANVEPLTLASVLDRITAAKGRRVHIVRIPWRLAWAGLRMLELAGLAPPFRSDSVVSLVGLDRDPFGPEGPPTGFRPFRP